MAPGPNSGFPGHMVVCRILENEQMRKLSTFTAPFPVYKVRLSAGCEVAACFSRTGHKLLICKCSDGRLEPLTQMGGVEETPLASEEWSHFVGPSSSFLDVAFHADDERMAVVGNGRPIEIFRIRDTSLVESVGVLGTARSNIEGLPPILAALNGYSCVVFTESGTRLVASGRSLGNRRNEVYDIDDAELLGSFYGGHDSYAYVDDWDMLAAVINDQGGSDIQFFQPLDRFAGIQGSPWDSPRVRVLDDEDMEGWDPGIYEVCGVTFSPEGDRIAVNGGFDEWSLSIFDFPGMNLICSYSDGPFLHGASGVSNGPVFHPDGRRVLIPSSPGSIVEVDSNTGEPLRRHRLFRDACTTLDLDHLSGLAVACSAGGEVAVLEIET
jgi:WD40 repeat protein